MYFLYILKYILYYIIVEKQTEDNSWIYEDGEQLYLNDSACFRWSQTLHFQISPKTGDEARAEQEISQIINQ